jgi:hypothetical protein
MLLWWVWPVKNQIKNRSSPPRFSVKFTWLWQCQILPKNGFNLTKSVLLWCQFNDGSGVISQKEDLVDKIYDFESKCNFFSIMPLQRKVIRYISHFQTKMGVMHLWQLRYCWFTSRLTWGIASLSRTTDFTPGYIAGRSCREELLEPAGMIPWQWMCYF